MIVAADIDLSRAAAGVTGRADLSSYIFKLSEVRVAATMTGRKRLSLNAHAARI
jgi:hypothetical protein